MTTHRKHFSLHWALENSECDLENIREHLSVNTIDERGNTPLIYAVKNEKCSLPVLKLLLAHGANVNIKGQGHSMPLHHAVLNPSFKLDAVNELIKAGADVNAVDGRSRTPLHLAVALYPSKVEVVRTLLKAGVAVNASDNENLTPLHLAVETRCTQMEKMRLLLKVEAPTNVKNSVSKNTFHCITSSKDEGSSLLKNASGFTSTNVCINTWMRKREIVQELVKFGANLNATDRMGNTPLHRVTEHSLIFILDAMRCLVSLGADINAKNGQGFTPLHLLLKNEKCDLDDVKEFIRRGASIAQRYVNNYTVDQKAGGETLLHLAVENDNCSLDLVKYLISLGIDLNAKDRYYNTALHIAARKGHSNNILRFLFASGADLEARNFNESTALHQAISCDDPVRVAKELISLGADVNTKEAFDRTALHLAVYSPINYDVVNLLLMHGARLDIYDWGKCCPIHLVHNSSRYRFKTKCMLLMLKYAILNDCYNPKNYRLFKEYHSYREAFRREIKLMKDTVIVKELNLWDVVTNNSKLMTEVNNEDVFISSLPLSFLTQLPQKFPTYHDVILHNLPKKYLVLNVIQQVQSVASTHKKQPVDDFAMNLECVTKLASFLTNKDLYNFMLSFSFPFYDKLDELQKRCFEFFGGPKNKRRKIFDFIVDLEDIDSDPVSSDDDFSSFLYNIIDRNNRP